MPRHCHRCSIHPPSRQQLGKCKEDYIELYDEASKDCWVSMLNLAPGISSEPLTTQLAARLPRPCT